ncbi:hypothetical protein B6N60_02747 [Richelia sinica FACHB-800]|uniref:Uncharacterized protein n=1 Tax=Richelia sinica FACHB-800 TaxID=1357546 RepID=A0A975Y5B4_9NOST|nr:hypothetical protein [Richelia sinica]MBD2667198.1 hypothetical protein [Richelia sinica FACHB-800]QXE24044.1 hypothetical protein B6N60_02747 [Richelia sinica FACHB-800]
MSYFVVDTNVPIVANEKANQASPACVLNCANKLREIQKQHIIVLDDTWLIINEYKNKLSPSGQPGVGDAFFKWVLTNQANPQRCQQVKITPTAENGFQEFPEEESLANFDKSDRKFVAVALTHPEKPPILNAVDSDWKNFEIALKNIGITIIFLCSELTTRP